MDSTTPLGHFRQSYFGPVGPTMGYWNSWHIRYETDGAGLAILTLIEQQEAKAELLLAVQNPLDPRPLLGLGYLSSEAALPALHRCLAVQGTHSWSTHAIRAIAQIDPAALHQTQLLHSLTYSPAHENPLSDPLIDLLLGLRLYFPLVLLESPVIEQIINLLHHPKGLVRVHALQMLREFYVFPTAAQETAQDIERSQSDPIFQLIRQDGSPLSYHEAERLLRIAAQATSGAPGA
ncbi:hypothetical protein GCM10022409_12950 [Hymenobacter glaciei]|uniref:HEAT repeat domain-containing protein n=1 Tax=Hymenobacter glaciei TaxID=877209 RepID=A0ABP7TRG0_9BACT